MGKGGAPVWEGVERPFLDPRGLMGVGTAASRPRQGPAEIITLQQYLTCSV